MTLKTHAIAGAAVYTAISGVNPYVVVAAVMAQTPDIDINFMHRGPVHSLLVATFVIGIAWLAYPPLALPVACGWLSHLLLDSTTMSGVELLWPWRRRLGVKLTRTGGPVDHMLRWVLIAYMAYALSVWTVSMVQTLSIV